MDKASLTADQDVQSYVWSLTVLDQVSVAVGQSLILEAVLESGLGTLVEAFDYDAGATVISHPPPQLHVAGQVGILPASVKSWLTDDTGGGQVMTSPGAVVWPHNPDPGLWPPDLIQAGQALVCVPMRVGGEVLGVVALTAERPRNLSLLEMATLEKASGRLALAVRNALRYHQVCDGDEDLGSPTSSEYGHPRVSLLYQVARELGGQLDTNQLLDQILALAPRIGAQFAHIIIEEKDGTLHFRSTAPGHEEFEGSVGRRLARSKLDMGAEGWVLEHQQPLLIADTVSDDRWHRSPYLNEMDRSALCLPLGMGRAGARGTWTLTSGQPDAFRAEDVPLAESVAAQVAVALENTLLFRAESERSAHLSLINEVSQAAASILSLDLMLNTITQAIQRRFGYLRVSIFLVDVEARVVAIRSQAGAYSNGVQAVYRQKLGEGLVGRAAQESHTELANDVRRYPGYLRLGPSAEAVRAELAVPIRLGSKVVGVLDLQSEETDVFSPQDVTTMELLADQLSIAIENARLYGEIRQRVEELTTLNKISQAVTSTLDLQETLTIITDHTTRLLGVAATSVILYDETQGDLWFAAASGEGSALVREVRLAVGQGIAGWVFQQGQPVLVPDTSQDSRWFGGVDQESGFTTRSILCVPLQAKGQTIGAIEAMNKDSGPFGEQDLHLLTLMAAPAATAIENAKLYEAVRQGMRKLEETQAQLVQSAKLAAVGELAAGVAHEINNPLTSIIGFTRLLLEDIPPDHKMRADLETIDREAGRTRRIVQTLLDFARTSDPVLAPADLNAVVEEAVMLVCTRSVLATVSLEKSLSPLPLMMLDTNQIKQVLVNLLNNAVHAMPDGGRLSVGTRLAEHHVYGLDRHMAVVYVTDSGIGIPPEDLGRIFDPFFTTKEVGHGTGLGLSVSYSIIEKHHGRIEVESVPGEGSKFSVLLPVNHVAQRVDQAITGMRDRE